MYDYIYRPYMYQMHLGTFYVAYSWAFVFSMAIDKFE